MFLSRGVWKWDGEICIKISRMISLFIVVVKCGVKTLSICECMLSLGNSVSNAPCICVSMRQHSLSNVERCQVMLFPLCYLQYVLWIYDRDWNRRRKKKQKWITNLVIWHDKKRLGRCKMEFRCAIQIVLDKYLSALFMFSLAYFLRF